MFSAALRCSQQLRDVPSRLKMFPTALRCSQQIKDVPNSFEMFLAD